LLRLVHAQPGITRTEACERLGLASGAAAELIERLRRAHLIGERRAKRDAPGRPTTVLTAHPDGPLALVIELSMAGWRIWCGDLDGSVSEVAASSYGNQDPAGFLPGIAKAAATAARGYGNRVRTVAAAVAGTVSGTRLLQFSTRGWDEADLSVLTSRFPSNSAPLLLAGNDAALAGLAEARGGAARGARVALHLLVAVGVGGALIVDGQMVAGAQGAGGEYGHLPLGDPGLQCPCGARGCWDLMVDGRALARHRGDAPPTDPLAYARNLLNRLRPGTDSRDRAAAELTARDLGAGIGGLANAHDPDIITVGGIAPNLRAAAPDAFNEAYLAGLMTFHRRNPPPVLDATYGDEGPVRGALALAFDEITSPASLATWV
jgi:predicted NBD/HSP70 family sugar kinase